MYADTRLCAAIVDRSFGGNILETGTDSYRLATTSRTRRTENRRVDRQFKAAHGFGVYPRFRIVPGIVLNHAQLTVNDCPVPRP